jgi:hypothetical protein
MLDRSEHPNLFDGGRPVAAEDGPRSRQRPVCALPCSSLPLLALRNVRARRLLRFMPAPIRPAFTHRAECGRSSAIPDLLSSWESNEPAGRDGIRL